MVRFSYLFLATALEEQKGNFNFNREINDARIKVLKVMLPITPEGEPDYEYIERYAKNMMFRKYKQDLDYLD